MALSLFVVMFAVCVACSSGVCDNGFIPDDMLSVRKSSAEKLINLIISKVGGNSSSSDHPSSASRDDVARIHSLVEAETSKVNETNLLAEAVTFFANRSQAELPTQEGLQSAYNDMYVIPCSASSQRKEELLAGIDAEKLSINNLQEKFIYISTEITHISNASEQLAVNVSRLSAIGAILDDADVKVKRRLHAPVEARIRAFLENRNSYTKIGEYGLPYFTQPRLLSLTKQSVDSPKVLADMSQYLRARLGGGNSALAKLLVEILLSREFVKERIREVESLRTELGALLSQLNSDVRRIKLKIHQHTIELDDLQLELDDLSIKS